MDVKKTIAELTSRLTEIDYDSDEDNILLQDPVQHSDDDDHIAHNFEKSELRKATDLSSLPENVYGGRNTSRKKINPFAEISNHAFSENDRQMEDGIHDKNDDDNSDNDDDFDDLSGSENSLTDSDEIGENETESSHSKKPDTEAGAVDCNIYSAGSKNIPNDIKKGTAIKNQLRIWESLLEFRIKVQKALSASNSLPTKETMKTMKLQLDSENQLKVNRCKKNLVALLAKLVDLQEELLKQSLDYNKNKDVNSQESADEIPSDDSGLENEEEKFAIEDENGPPRKKRKLNEYASLLKTNYDNFIPFRNTSIQKWNDKTKVSTGKMASSNFSAFDQSTLKQIEQIMADKQRLINRTRIKKNNDDKKSTDDQSLQSQETCLDAEIFDDTDFYHKLLRDYIERKSVYTNSSNTERQLIELQKLRSKMKRIVDTRSTKGRKIRYVVLPKLVNFMAPHPYNTWSETAETELYNSLFGQIKLK